METRASGLKRSTTLTCRRADLRELSTMKWSVSRSTEELMRQKTSGTRCVRLEDMALTRCTTILMMNLIPMDPELTNALRRPEPLGQPACAMLAGGRPVICSRIELQRLVE